MVWSKMAQAFAGGDLAPSGELNINMVGIAFRGEEYCAGRCFIRVGHQTYPAMAILNGSRRIITTDDHAIERLASWGCGLRIARRIVARAVKEANHA